jgi:hypothetical protein
MRSLWKAFGVAALAVVLSACGGGGGDAGAGVTPPANGGTPAAQTPAGPVTSVTVNGSSVDFTQPVVVRNDQLVDVRFPSAGSTNFNTTATLNGTSTTATMNISTLSGTQWAARIASAPGSVFRLVVTQGSAATTLTFNVESSFQGSWNASYTGGDSGSCTGLAVSKAGAVSGQCSSAALGAIRPVAKPNLCRVTPQRVQPLLVLCLPAAQALAPGAIAMLALLALGRPPSNKRVILAG